MADNVKFIPYEEDGCFNYIKVIRGQNEFMVYYDGNKHIFKMTPELNHDFEDGSCSLLLSKLFDKIKK